MQSVNSCVSSLREDKEKLIITSWRITLVFVACFVIAAIAFAAHNDSGEVGTSRSDGFAAIWAMILIVGLSVGGTMVLKKYRKPLAIGFFLGVCVMMSVNMLTLFAIFVGLAQMEKDATDSTPSSDNAAAAFAFFLCLCYGGFSFVLSKHKDTLVAGGSMAGQDGQGVAGENSGDSAVSV
eukprot:g5582.t1